MKYPSKDDKVILIKVFKGYKHNYASMGFLAGNTYIVGETFVVRNETYVSLYKDGDPWLLANLPLEFVTLCESGT